MTTAGGVMCAEERLQATIRLEKTDKVPNCPSLGYYPATCAEITPKQFLFDRERADAAVEKVFRVCGGWDVMMGQRFDAVALPVIFPMKVRMPGVDLPEDSIHQLVEEEIMTVDDYDFIAEHGYGKFMSTYFSKIHPAIPPDQVPEMRARNLKAMKEDIDKWAERGVTTLIGGVSMEPFGRFSYMRSLAKFALDIYRIPDRVKAAVDACLPDAIAMAKNMVDFTGIRRVFIGNARSSATFISPKQYERFVLPYMEKLVEALVAENITPVFHFDSDWTPFLPFFKEYPKGRCVLELDGSTDIFKAKEILGGHMCLMGDVSASLLVLGTPEEVTDYCQKLIEVVGDGGGFIFSCGCEIPVNARPENVKAMVKAGNELGWYNRE